jgi:hypothetical protein
MREDEDSLENLPPGERVLWQGRPGTWDLATHAFHFRGFAVYFAALLTWYFATLATDHTPLNVAAQDSLRMFGIALVPLLVIIGYAWIAARSALYSITDRRVVMSVGVVVPVTINLPFARIAAAGWHGYADGRGNIALSLAEGEKLAYFLLWPHAKPWRVAKPEPMLRCVPDAGNVANILARALAASAGTAVQVSGAQASVGSARPEASAIA